MVLNEKFIEMVVAVKVAQIANFLGLEVASKNPTREFGGMKIEVESLRIPESGYALDSRSPNI